MKSNSENTKKSKFIDYSKEVKYAVTSFNLRGHMQRFEQNQYFKPDYQRNYVWNKQQASKLIESFIVGLPVPPVILLKRGIDVSIIDGQQRLYTIKNYFENKFPNQQRTNDFKLILDKHSCLYKKSFTELTDEYKFRLENARLDAIEIEDPNIESQFEIYERLNTGGSNLNPQEIRNCLFRGRLLDQLINLNSDLYWLSIIGAQKPSNRYEDVEYLLRIYAHTVNLRNINGSIKLFLDQTVKQFVNDDISSFCSDFKYICMSFRDFYKEPIKIKNGYILECLLLPFLQDNKLLYTVNSSQIQIALDYLEKIEYDSNQEYKKHNVETRIEKVRQIYLNDQGVC